LENPRRKRPRPADPIGFGRRAHRAQRCGTGSIQELRVDILLARPHARLSPPSGAQRLVESGASSSSERLRAPGRNSGRNQEAGGGFVKLNSQLLPTPIFRDKTVKPGERYAYRVNAVDRAGNVSAPSEEINLEAR